MQRRIEPTEPRLQCGEAPSLIWLFIASHNARPPRSKTHDRDTRLELSRARGAHRPKLGRRRGRLPEPAAHGGETADHHAAVQLAALGHDARHVRDAAGGPHHRAAAAGGGRSPALGACVFAERNKTKRKELCFRRPFQVRIQSEGRKEQAPRLCTKLLTASWYIDTVRLCDCNLFWQNVSKSKTEPPHRVSQ